MSAPAAIGQVPVRVRDLSRTEIAASLSQGWFGLRTGPFWSCITSRDPSVADGLRRLYAEHPVRMAPPFADFHVGVVPVAGARSWIRPQVTFTLDGVDPFKPLPGNQAFPLLEWGLNWCIASLGHRWLLTHAAVLARGEDVLVLPAASGSGKSTLCAALAYSGWRLFSDEVLLLEPESGLVHPLARPIHLKNESIDVIRGAFPEVVSTSPVSDTRKGTVAHFAPGRESVEAMDVPGRIRWIVFPKWEMGAPTLLSPVDPPEVFEALVKNAFNYEVQGEAGFVALARLARESRGYRFTYSRLDEAVAAFATLR